MFRPLLISLCFICSTVSAGTPIVNEDYKLLASDGASGDYFGYSVAISGDTVVVGAGRDDDNGSDSGSAYIYRFDGNNWIETKLLASDGSSSDIFGWSVAISGDTIVVGAGRDDDNGSDSGSAYIYRFDGNNWIETKLLASDGTSGDYFGISVATSGDTVVVGARYDEDNGSDSGSAYVYRFDGNNWIETKLLASDGTSGDHFGTSVAISGDTVVVGAGRDDDNGDYSGSAYIYRFDGNNWIETKLLASDGTSGDYFGISVATSGDTVVVGAVLDDDNVSDSGSAYVYRFDGNNWIEIKLLASDGAFYDYFGISVAISGDTIVVGAHQDDDNGDYSGSAYIYRFDGNNWIETKLLASDGSSSDIFGWSVAISGDTIVVGANLDDDNGSDSGSAYIFTALATTWTVDDDGKADFDNIQAAIDAASDGDEIVVMPGTYTSTQDGHVVNMLGKAVTLRSSDPSDPDVVAATIIDGEFARRGLACFNNETSNTIVSGFTITNGYGVGFDYNGNGDIGGWEYYGGGMYNHTSSNPTLTNCIFENNTTNGNGGGMFNELESSPTMTDCTFTNNTAGEWGGGMDNLQSSPTLTNCTFTGNTAGVDGGGMSNYFNSPTLTNCTFENNTSYNGGGGMYNDESNTTLTNCIFINNMNVSKWGPGGGGMGTSGGNLLLTNCKFISNSTTQRGGGMCNRGSNLTLTLKGCTFTDNTAAVNGGGMYNSSNPPTLTDTTVCGNTPDQIYGDWTDNGGNWVADVCECLADINGDGYVNVTDLLIVIDQWGLTNSPADVNFDGIVDVSDLLIVVGNWGACE